MKRNCMKVRITNPNTQSSGLQILTNTVLIVLSLLLLGGRQLAIASDEYPARCQTTTDLWVRSGPSGNDEKLGCLKQSEYVTVKETTSNNWGVIDYNGQEAYISMRYVNYIEPVGIDKSESSSVKKSESGIAKFFSEAWRFIKDIFSEAFGFIAFIFGDLGDFLGWLPIALAVMLCIVFLFRLSRVVYYIFSFPIYILNQIEHILIEPWRYIFRRDWVNESLKPVLRIFLEILSVLLYIAFTPLRLLNAVIYNILVHCVMSLYDLLCELFMPCDSKEGAGSVWRWILMFLWRLLKYPVYHWLLTVIESVLWTVVDIFIPARTLYHGTDKAACNAIAGDPNRNKYREKTSQWSTGTFLASTHPECTWAGRGVYFAINRKLALGYSDRASQTGDDSVMIVCRVSMGRVINYTLAPHNVYMQAGRGGNHDVINKFADSHRYTTGEWYNNRQQWEYCLFDWQNRYNHPWRIRPVYVINTQKFRIHHVSGGVQHWLFDKAVLNDIFGRK